MKLSALSGEAMADNPEIVGLTADSRAVRPGFLFAALPGERVDGAQFIPQAEEAGAAAVLSAPGARSRVVHIVDANPRRRLAEIAARFFPRQPETIAGITGTNGKTSTARFAAQLWTALGEDAGSLGTLGAQSKSLATDGGLTTPDPIALHEMLDAMAAGGTTHLAMEVSSHALAQHRADGARFRVAAFTNLTQDHLDYHRDFDAYRAAKLRLFSEALSADGAAVVNADGAGAAAFIDAARGRKIGVLTTGVAGDDIKIDEATPTAAGLDCRIVCGGEHYALRLPLIGAFQAENAALAAGIVIASGGHAGDVLPALEALEPVPGRMERVAEANGAGVYVDYAHTPDAIETALRAIRPHARGRVIAIIGAGGDRDRTKRPLMGAAAARHADAVIVTDDNPRMEEPGAIRRALMEGAPAAREIAGRGEAIAAGVAMARAGDVVLIAGKGHERGQDIGGEVLPFDDAAVARDAAQSAPSTDHREKAS